MNEELKHKDNLIVSLLNELSVLSMIITGLRKYWENNRSTRYKW